jgi:p-aminobenzoyl-glutamate transporter AbgT
MAPAQIYLEYPGNYLFQGFPTGTAYLLNRPIGDLDALVFLIPYASIPFIELGASPWRAIFLRFFDNSGTVFSSDALPTSIDLDDFSSSTITLHGDTGLALGYSIVGNISSLELTSLSVPEPTTLTLMTLGIAGIGFTRRLREQAR